MKKASKDKLTLILLGAAIVVASFFVCLQIINSGRIVYGAKVANFKIGGLAPDDAKNSLNEKIIRFQSRPLTIILGNKQVSLTPKLLGIEIDTDKTLAKITSIGHENNIFDGLKKQLLAPLGFYNLPLAIQINEPLLEMILRDNFSSFETPVINASLEYDKTINDFKLTSAKSGLLINISGAKKQLMDLATSLKDAPITIQLIQTPPEITDDEVTSAQTKAQEILNNLPHTLIANSEKSWQATKDDVIDWIKFEPTKDENNNSALQVTLDDVKVKDYLVQETASIVQLPINAVLAVKDNKIIISQPEQEGISVDLESSVADIKTSILNGANYTNLTLKKDQPRVTTNNLEELGLTSLLGKGSTYFIDSPVNRNQNIKIAGSKFNGILLEPNKEFIFGDYLGEVGPQYGYQSATVIKNGKHVQEYGGGICQVSTTAFRGAVWAGLKITERHPHSVPIPFYAPQGFDATVYPPAVDFKFVNDTPNYIYIQTKFESKKITFEYYGTKTWDEVKLVGPTEYDKKVDGSMKGVLTRNIYKDGKVIQKDTWYSSYKSPNSGVTNPLQ